MQKALGSNPSGSTFFHSELQAIFLLLPRVCTTSVFRDSIVVSISACHADDPGSIPGRGVFYFLLCVSKKKHGQ